MKSDRLLSALLLLQAHGRLTGRDLAGRLGVSLRTVHRDMDSLSAAGVPIFALRGSRGGWQIDEGWRTQVPGLDEAELRALLMAQPRVIGDPGLAAAAESAIRKLMAALPGAMRARAAAIRQRLFVDTTGWRPPAESLAMLPVVQDAVWTDRRLEFEYSDSRQSVSTRVVDPLGLVSKGGAWYLFANSAKGFRTYRVSRIQSARVLDEPCLRPPDFDLEAQWKLAMDRFSRERTKFPVILWLDSTGVNWAQQWLDLSPGPDPDTYGIAFDAEEQAAFVVLGLASHARVVGPPALADRVRREFSAALSIASASLRD